MTNDNHIPTTNWNPSSGLKLALLLGLWFALAAVAGMTGMFAVGPEQLARPVLLTILAPVALFLAACAGSGEFRKYILSRDIRLLTMMLSWRVIGFAFLPLYAYEVLPGLFAWPAGLGDAAMGLTAPLMVWALMRNPSFAASRGFIVWNLLGLLDFAVAGVTSTLASGAVAGLVSGSLTSAPMEVWPLSLFPSFGVPLFMFMHFTVLFQAWESRRAAAPRTGTARDPAPVDEVAAKETAVRLRNAVRATS